MVFSKPSLECRSSIGWVVWGPGAQQRNSFEALSKIVDKKLQKLSDAVRLLRSKMDGEVVDLSWVPLVNLQKTFELQ